MPDPARPHRIDFDAINRTALASLPALLSRWFPAGRRNGQEFVRIVYRDRVVYRDPPPEEDCSPDWIAIAAFCAARIHKLNAKEAGFVRDMAVQVRLRKPTEKQGNWLASIYSKLKRAEGASS